MWKSGQTQSWLLRPEWPDRPKQVGIAGHIKIGDHVSLGAQSGVHASIADGNTLMGTPAVDARKFMRISAYNNRLGDIFARVKEIEKELKNQSSK